MRLNFNAWCAQQLPRTYSYNIRLIIIRARKRLRLSNATDSDNQLLLVYTVFGFSVYTFFVINHNDFYHNTRTQCVVDDEKTKLFLKKKKKKISRRIITYYLPDVFSGKSHVMIASNNIRVTDNRGVRIRFWELYTNEMLLLPLYNIQ